MHYTGTIIRPPSEADSILLQVTQGCSYNQCTFCPAYKNKPFRCTDAATVHEDILYAAEHFTNSTRLFLCDGDALILPQEKLLNILSAIKQKLPLVERVASYANAKCVALKTDQELAELRALGLRLVHMGLESGDDQTLAAIKKYGTSQDHIKQARRLKAAGIQVFVTVILGIGGTIRSNEHAVATGKVLSKMDPQFIGALTLMLPPEAPLFADHQQGKFNLLSPEQTLEELRSIISHLSLTNGILYANHASNYMPLRARLPRDKERTLTQIDNVLKGEHSLKPEWLRGL